MTELNVRLAMESLKLKNAEGFDRIPQLILIDGAELLYFNIIETTNIS